jgi:predicted dehydrogenase/nucleoside-diphosphate-sugar epimerase
MVHRLALVGCGAVSQNYYVPACRKHSECTIEWFVDANVNKAKELAKIYGRGKISGDYREVVDDVDAAIIALPNYLHSPASIYFLEHGRDVLCEKPIATNSIDALKMIKTSQKSGARLAVGLIRRRLSSCRIAKSLIDRGHFAKFKQVTIEEGHVFDWPVSSLSFLDRGMAGGGVLVDWGPHVIDLLQWLFSADLELVSYADDGLGGVEANVDAQLIIRKPGMSEVPCRILLSRTRRLRNRILISGDNASLEIRQSDPDSVYSSIDGIATVAKALKGKSLTDCFAEQIAAFLDKSSEDYASGPDALRSLAFIELCYNNHNSIAFPWERKTKTKLHLTFPSRYRNILLVGASGFVGTRLAERLYLDYNLKVRATIHRAHTAVRVARLPLEFVSCDVLDLEQVMRAAKGCEVIVNCSRGTAGPNEGVDFFERGTSNLLKAAVENEVRKFIHVSTASVHRFGRKGQVVNETSELDRSRDPYVAGKIKAEKMVMEYSSSLPVAILRPMLIYGPYSKDWVVQIVNRLKNQQTTIIGDRGLASLIYIDDFVDALLLTIEREEADGEAFIISNDKEEILWKDYVRKYAETLGISPAVSPESNLLMQKLRNTFSLIGDSLAITKGLLNSSEALAVAAKIPLVLKLGEIFVKGPKREQVQSKLATDTVVTKPDPKILLKYETISSGLYRVFTSQATFSSAKAREMLSFEPKASFKDGIDATLDWVRWMEGFV